MEQKQEYWGWLATGYFFLAAMGAMMAAVVAMLDVLGVTVIDQIYGWVSFAALVITGCGSLLLMVELTHIFRAYLVYARPKSIMCMGSYLLTSFLGLTFVYTTFFIYFVPWSGWVLVRKLVAVLDIVAALGLVVYPGLELAEARGRSFWQGSGLVALFLVSATSTGLAGVLLMLIFFELSGSEYLGVLSTLLTVSLVLQLVLLGSYLWGVRLNGTKEGRQAILNMVKGPYCVNFWGGVVVLGTLIPLGLSILGKMVPFAVGAAALVLIGGLFFRRTFLQAAERISMPGEENQQINDQQTKELAAALESRWMEKARWLKNQCS
ncbi:MAG: Polysulfide reductase, NrfD [Firmicutes bacterium]|nr:Polysulfide reductase, NrfD [Bacillota bacterium]